MGEKATTCDKLLSSLADARDMRLGPARGQSTTDARSFFFLAQAER